MTFNTCMLITLIWPAHNTLAAKLKCKEPLLHGSRDSVYMGRYGDGALVDLHGETDPVRRSHLQGLLQHRSRLLPVRVLAQGADADFLVQVDVVPEGNRS